MDDVEKKTFTLRLTPEQFELFEKGAKAKKVNKTQYLVGLIEADNNTKQISISFEVDESIFHSGLTRDEVSRIIWEAFIKKVQEEPAEEKTARD